MVRALRKSTLDQREHRREETDLKLKKIELKSKKGFTDKKNLKLKSRRLQEQIDRNQANLQLDIERLTASTEDSSSESSPSVSSPSRQLVDSAASLAWDEQGDIRSPLKDTSDILDSTFHFREEDSSPPALSRSRSVSVSVNRASYVREESSGNLIDLQPVCRSLNLDLGSSFTGASGLISQDSFLERNIRAKEAETLELISEEVAEESSRMDENSFQAKLKTLKDKYRRVSRRIAQYSAGDVQIADAEQYKAELKDIKDFVNVYIEEVEVVLDCLESTEEERIALVNKLIDDATSAMKKNEKEVKEKITSLIAANVTSVGTLDVEEAKSKVKVDKLQKRIDRVKEKAEDGKKKATDLAVNSSTTDNEIREFLHKSKKLESLMEELVKNKDDIDEESIGLDIRTGELEDMNTTV